MRLVGFLVLFLSLGVATAPRSHAENHGADRRSCHFLLGSAVVVAGIFAVVGITGYSPIGRARQVTAPADQRNGPAWDTSALEERVRQDMRNNWNVLLSDDGLRDNLRDLLIRRDHDTYLEYSDPNGQHLARAEFDSIAELMAPFRSNPWMAPRFRVVTTFRERPLDLANLDLVASEVPEGESRTIDSLARERLLFRFGNELEGPGEIRITVNVLVLYSESGNRYRHFQIDRIELGDVP